MESGTVPHDRPKGMSWHIEADPPRSRLPRMTLDDPGKRELHRQWRTGVSIDALAAQSGLRPERVEQIVNEIWARQIRAQSLDFIYHPSFDCPGIAAVILASAPSLGTGKPRPRVPNCRPPARDGFDTFDPLLSAEQERHLFRKMNYLKFRARRIRDRLDPVRARTSALVSIEHLLTDALSIKNQIIRANLRLVISIAKRRLGMGGTLLELVSDGNVSLIRAVDKFDFSRGFKFSTYASWSIINNFARNFSDEKRRRDRFITGCDEVFDFASDYTDELTYESDHSRYREAVHALLGKLDDRERLILVRRFGIGGVAKQSLDQLGKELGISKERVRQIESRAQEKARMFALDARIDPESI